jgi:Spy/CpxP family protein refolding chaperone
MKKKVEAMRRRMGPVGLSLLAAALTAAAFAAVSTAAQDGDDDKEGSPPQVFQHVVPGPPPELSEEDQKQLQEFRQCMQDNGAPAPPDPGEMRERFRSGEMPKPPSEAEIEKLRKAHEACEDELPEDAGFGFHVGPDGPGAPGCGPPRSEEGSREGASASGVSS